MKVIRRHSVSRKSTIEVPLSTRILDVDAIDGEIVIWTEEDDQRLTHYRTFVVLRDGDELPGNVLNYVGRVSMRPFRFFVYEVGVPKSYTPGRETTI